MQATLPTINCDGRHFFLDTLEQLFLYYFETNYNQKSLKLMDLLTEDVAHPLSSSSVFAKNAHKIGVAHGRKYVFQVQNSNSSA